MANDAQYKIDPIRGKYFRPLEIADKTADILFYFTAALSLAAWIIEKATNSKLYAAAQLGFALSVIALFLASMAIRLYFSPRAHEKRYQDFLSHAFGIPITYDQTAGYYTKVDGDPVQRVALQSLENSFYSKDTIQQMAVVERIKIAAYFAIWLVIILNRGGDIAVVPIIAQIIFSEQIILRYLRIEWLRIQFTKVFEDLFRLFQTRPEPNRFEAMTWEILGRYEAAKANAAITLSSKIFTARQPQNEKEWANVKALVGIRD